MTDRELEERIRMAAEHTAPDDLDRILSLCTEQNQGSAADLVTFPRLGPAGSFRVILDVNPSVYLEVDGEERVIRAEALNEDAKRFLGGTDLVGLPLETAVDAVVESMKQEGYLSKAQNSILVSVEYSGNGSGEGSGSDTPGLKDDGRREELQKKVSAIVERAMEDSLDETETGVSVLSQTVDDDDELAVLAGEYGISMGKAALIRKLLPGKASRKDFEELASLSVNEIALLMQEGNMKNDTVTQIGHASDKAYIGQNGALKAAMGYAGVKSIGQVKKPKVKIDTYKGRMAYKVKLKTNHGKYKYLLDARTGDIVGCKNKGKNGNKYKYKSKGEKSKYKDKANKSKFKSKGEKYKYKDKGKKYKERSYDMSGKKKEKYKYYGKGDIPTDYAPMEIPEGAIGEQAAKAAALAHAGIPENQALYVNCNPQIGHGPDHYDVKFVAGGMKYKYAIGLYDGTVLGRAVKDKAHKGKYVYEGNYHEHYAPMGPGMGTAAAAPQKPAGEDTDTGADPNPQPQQTSAGPDPQPQCGEAPGGVTVPLTQTPTGDMIDEQQALAIAMQKAGLTPEKLIRWKLKIREKHGCLVYRFKLKVPGYEYELDVDAYSGNVTKFHKEEDY